MSTVSVKKGRAKPLWFGHPWLYSQAVDRVSGEPEAGDVVDVLDERARFIGRGFYNPRSQIAVRLATRREEPVDAGFIARRIASARALRARLGLPSAETTAYRLVNAEGDGLPGLVVDVYGEVATIQISSLGMFRLREAVLDALEAELKPSAIYQVKAGSVAEREGFEVTAGAVRGEAREWVEFRESGFSLSIDPLGGQKTGAFLDQRDNRRRIGELARGARFLDAYTYIGGFSLAALRGGATGGVAIDISPRALARAEDHVARAGFGGRLETVERDVFKHLEAVEPASFDLVILDPPKFAPSRRDLEAALKGYRRLNGLGMRATRPGGLLATASCSQAVDATTFERTLAGAAVDAGRTLSVLEVRHHAADHPVPPGFTEGHYLKMFLCRVE